MTDQLLTIDNPDGSSNKITIFQKLENDSAPVIMVFPAMGVRASFYEPLCRALVEAGFIAISADLRGHGHSSLRPSAKIDFGYTEMIHQDYTSIFQKVKSIYPENKCGLLGHSLGGQIGALYASKNPQNVDALILVACCSVYYKGWTGLRQIGTLFGTQFMALIATVLGYFPGKKVGFGGLEAKSVMRDWSRQARTGKYRPKNDDFDYENALNQLDIPILAVSFSSDTFAPKKAVGYLLEKFKSAKVIEHNHLAKASKYNDNYNHFNWAKKPAALAKLLDRWLRERV